MRKLQARIIAELGVKQKIDPEAEIERRIQFLCDYSRATKTSGFVLGISGGVDSTLAGRLTTLAVNRLRDQGEHATFNAVRLPHGSQMDEKDAQKAMDFVDAPHQSTINIKDSVAGLEKAYRDGLGENFTDFNRGNVKARVRMVAQYAIAGDHNLLVIGTDHASESVVGFFTKFGDGAADVLPLSGLLKKQSRRILRHLGAPEKLWAKVPTADLLDERPLRPDESELGIPYSVVDDYLLGKKVTDEMAQRIEAIWLSSRHKRRTPVTVEDDWWRSA